MGYAPRMAERISTSLRLDPKERALIAEAAETLGDDIGSFIRDAARDRAESVLADAAYRHFMVEKLTAANKSKAKPVSQTEAKRRLARRRSAR